MPKILTVNDYIDQANHDPVTAFNTPIGEGPKKPKTLSELAADTTSAGSINNYIGRDESTFIPGVANTPFESDNEIKAQEEGYITGGLSSLVKLGISLPGAVMQGAGNLYDGLTEPGGEYKSALTQAGDSWLKWTSEALPTYYSSQSGKLSWDYLQKFTDQNPATIGLMLMTMGIGAPISAALEGTGAALGSMEGIGAAGEAVGIGGKLAAPIRSALQAAGMSEEGMASLAKFGNQLATGAKINRPVTAIGTAAISRVSESNMEANQTFNDATAQETRKALANGEDPEDPKVKQRIHDSALEKSKSTFYNNMPLMALDALEFGAIFKTLGSIGLKKLVPAIETMTMEGGEEGVQSVIQSESLRDKGDRGPYSPGFGDRLKKYVTDQDFVDSVIMGAMGGLSMLGAGAVVSKYNKTMGKYKTFNAQQTALEERGKQIAKGENTDSLDDNIFASSTLNSLYHYDAVDSHIEGLETLLGSVSKINKNTTDPTDKAALDTFNEKNGERTLYGNKVTAKEFFEDRLSILKDFKKLKETHIDNYGISDSNKYYSVLDSHLNKILNTHAIKAYETKLADIGVVPEFKSAITTNLVQSELELEQAKHNLAALSDMNNLPEEYKNIPKTELEKHRLIAERIVQTKEQENNKNKGDYLSAIKANDVDVLADKTIKESIDGDKRTLYNEISSLKNQREVNSKWQDRLIHLYTNPKYQRSTIKQRYNTQIDNVTNTYDVNYIASNINNSKDLNDEDKKELFKTLHDKHEQVLTVQDRIRQAHQADVDNLLNKVDKIQSIPSLVKTNNETKLEHEKQIQDKQTRQESLVPEISTNPQAAVLHDNLEKEIEAHKVESAKISNSNEELIARHKELINSGKEDYKRILEDRAKGARGTREIKDVNDWSNEQSLANIEPIFNENYTPPDNPPGEADTEINTPSGLIKTGFNAVAYIDSRTGNFGLQPTDPDLNGNDITETPEERNKSKIENNKFAILVNTGILEKHLNEIIPTVSIDHSMLNRAKSVSNKELTYLTDSAKKVLNPNYTWGSDPLAEANIGNVPIRISFTFRGKEYSTFLHDFNTMKNEINEFGKQKIEAPVDKDGNIIDSSLTFNVDGKQEQFSTADEKNADIFTAYQRMMTRAKAFVLNNQSQTITTKFTSVETGKFDITKPITATSAINRFITDKEQVDKTLRNDIPDPFLSTVNKENKVFNPSTQQWEKVYVPEGINIVGKPVIATVDSHGNFTSVFLQEKQIDDKLADILYQAILQEKTNRGKADFNHPDFKNIPPLRVLKLFLNLSNKKGLTHEIINNKGVFKFNGKVLNTDDIKNNAQEIKQALQTLYTHTDQGFLGGKDDFVTKFATDASLGSVTIRGNVYTTNKTNIQSESNYSHFINNEQLLMTDHGTLASKQANVRWGDLSVGKPQQQTTQQSNEPINDKEYEEYINKGNVPKSIIQQIAQKIVRNQTLSPREQAILANKGSEIETKIKELKESVSVEHVPTDAERQEFFKSAEDSYYDSIPELDETEDIDNPATNTEKFDPNEMWSEATGKKIVEANLEQLKKELDYFKKNIPQIPVHTVEGVIRIAGDRVALGSFITSLGFMKEFGGQFGVRISNKIEEGRPGVTYHEMIHPIFQLLLTRNEQSKIMEQLKRETPKVTPEMMKERGVDTEEKFHEETLAEKFRAWKNEQIEIPKGTLLERFFQSIKDLIDYFLGRKDVISKLFRDIDSGKFATRIPITNRISKFYSDHYSINSPHMSNHVYDKFLDITTIKLITDMDLSKYPKIKLDTSPENIKNIIKSIAKETNTLKDKQGNPVIILKESVAHKNFMAIKELVDTNFDKFVTDLNTKLKNKYSFTEEEEDVNESKSSELAAKTGGEYNVKNSRQAHLARLVVAQTLISNQFANPETGLAEVADLNDTYNLILKKLANIPQIKVPKTGTPVYNIDRYKEALIKASTDHQRPELERLAKLLDDLNKPESSKVLASFYGAITNDRADHRENMMSYENGKLVIKEKSSENLSKYEEITNQWNASMQNSSLVKNGELNLAVLNKAVLDLSNLLSKKITRDTTPASHGEIIRRKIKENIKYTDNLSKEFVSVLNNIGIDITKRGLNRAVEINDNNLINIIDIFAKNYLDIEVRKALKNTDGTFNFKTNDGVVRALALGEGDFRQDVKDHTYRGAAGTLGNAYELPSHAVTLLDRIYSTVEGTRGNLHSTDSDFNAKKAQPFNSNSKILDQITSDIRNKQERMRIVQYSTLVNENTGDLGEKARDIDPDDMLLVVLNSALKHYDQGKPSFRLRSNADKSQSDKFLTNFEPIGGNRNNVDDFVRRGGLNKGAFNSKVIDYFVGQLENEIFRAQSESKITSKNTIEFYHFNPNSKGLSGKAYLLNLFPELNLITNSDGKIVETLDDYFIRSGNGNVEAFRNNIIKNLSVDVEAVVSKFENREEFEKLRKDAFNVIKAIATKDIEKGSLRTQDTLRKYIAARLTNEVKQEINSYRKAGLLVGEDLVGLQTKALENFSTQDYYITHTTPTVHIAEDIIANVTINQMIVDIEQHHLIDNDPAYYKDLTDLSKREGAFNSAGVQPMLQEGIPMYTKTAHITTPNSSSDYYKEKNEDGTETPFYTKAKELFSKEFDHIKALYPNAHSSEKVKKEYVEKMIQNIVSAYQVRDGKGGIDTTDAQGEITLARHKELMLMFGKLNKTEADEIYDRLEKGTYTAEELNFSLQPLKLVLVSYHIDSDGRGYNVYHKYSVATLIPDIVGDKKLTQLKQMEDKGIGEVVYNSGVKFGLTNVTDISKPNYSLNPIEIANADYKLQVDLSAKGIHEELLGSQPKKNMLSMYDPNNEYKLPGEETGKQGSEVLSDIVGSVNELSNRATNKVKEGVSTDGVIDTRKFMDHVADMLLDRGISPNIDDLLRSSSTLDVAPHKNTISSNTLFSEWNKAAVKLRMPGMSAIQVSGYGMTTIKKLSELNSQEGIIRLQQKLNPTYLNEKGEMVLGSVYIPHTILDLINKIKKPGDDITDPKVLKEYLANENVLGLIGYRIPNQGPSSIDINQVAGFLPKHMGDTIYVYDEIPTKVGSDFDVDKMYVVLPNLEIKDDKVQRVPFLKEGEELYNKWLNEKINKALFDTNKELKSIIKQGENTEDEIKFQSFLEGTYLNEEFSNKEFLISLNNIFSNGEVSQDALDLLKDRRDELLKEKRERINQITETAKSDYDKLNIHEKNTKKANQNLLLESYERLMRDEKMWLSSIYPLDAATKPIKDAINKIVPSEKITGLAFYRPSVQLNIKDANTRAKDGIAYSANTSTDAKLSKIAEVTYHIGDLTIDYNKEFLRDQNAIINIYNGFLSAYADAVKDPYIIKANFNEYTFNVGIQLLKLGWGIETVVKFISNPNIIDIYNTYNKGNNNRFQKLQNPNAIMSKGNAFKQVLQSKGMLKDYLETTDNDRWGSFTKIMNTLRSTFEQNKELDPKTELNFLYAFEEIRKLADDIDLKQILASKFDTTGAGKSFAELLTKEQKLRQVMNIPNTEDGDVLYQRFLNAVKEGNLNKDTGLHDELNARNSKIKNFHMKFIGTELGVYFKKSLEIKNTYKDLSIRFSPIMQQAMIEIAKKIPSTKGYNDKNDSYLTNEKLANSLENYLYGMLMSGTPAFSYSKAEENRLFYGDNSLAKRFYNLTQKEVKDGGIKGTILSQALIPGVHNNPTLPQFIKTDNYKTKQADILNRISDEWYNLPDDIRRDLIKYSYLSSGFSFSRGTFFDQIPAQWFKEVGFESQILDVKDKLDNLLSNKSLLIDQIMRNNNRNRDLVERVYNSIESPLTSTYTSKRYKGPYITNIDYKNGNDRIWKFTGLDADGKSIYSDLDGNFEPIRKLGYDFNGKIVEYDIFNNLENTIPSIKKQEDSIHFNNMNTPDFNDYHGSTTETTTETGTPTIDTKYITPPLLSEEETNTDPIDENDCEVQFTL